MRRSSFFVTAVSWNKAGTKLYTGTSKGYLNIINVTTNKVRLQTLSCQICSIQRVFTIDYSYNANWKYDNKEYTME
jgi:uncharacterized protein YfaS (alpha-2-macroglobulin family)